MNAQVRPLSEGVNTGLLSQVLRQLNHWEGAAERLDDFEASASPEAWASLEKYVGVALRGGLKRQFALMLYSTEECHVRSKRGNRQQKEHQ